MLNWIASGQAMTDHIGVPPSCVHRSERAQQSVSCPLLADEILFDGNFAHLHACGATRAPLWASACAFVLGVCFDIMRYKYNGNNGYIGDQAGLDNDQRCWWQVAQAFSHYTHHASGGNYLVS